MKKSIIMIAALTCVASNNPALYASASAAAAAGAGACKAVVEHIHEKMSDEQSFAQARKMYHDAHLSTNEKKTFNKLLYLSIARLGLNLVQPEKMPFPQQSNKTISDLKLKLGFTNIDQFNNMRLMATAQVESLYRAIETYEEQLHCSDNSPATGISTASTINGLNFFEKLKALVEQDIIEEATKASTTKPAGGLALEGDAGEA